MGTDWRRIGLEAAVIFFLGIALGLSFNFRLVMDAFSGSLPALPGGTEEESAPAGRYPVPVTLEEVRQLLDDRAVAIDARAEELYAEGHLPGALSLPVGRADALIDSVLRKVGKDAVIVTYCSGYGCPDSFDLGVRLLEAGWRDVRVFEGGFPAWRDAGLPVAESGP